MLILLIGPKGSGKSHIGRVLQSRLGIHFLEVERLWIAYHAECRSVAREPTMLGGIERIHPAIAEALQAYTHVAIETTGASREILDHLLSLEQITDLLLVRITAPLQTCIERVATRNPEAQLPADRAMVEKVHELSSALELPFDILLDNEGLTEEEIVEAFVRRVGA